MSLDAHKVALRWRLHPTHKLVALVLASYHNPKTGACYPSISTLVEGTGLGRRAVINAVKSLERLGCIVCERRSGTSTLYRFILDAVPIRTRRASRTGASGARVHPVHRCTGAARAPHPCTGCTLPVHTMHPNL